MTTTTQPVRLWLAVLKIDDGEDRVLASRELPADGEEAERWLVEVAEARPKGELVYLAHRDDRCAFWSGKAEVAKKSQPTSALVEHPAADERPEPSVRQRDSRHPGLLVINDITPYTLDELRERGLIEGELLAERAVPESDPSKRTCFVFASDKRVCYVIAYKGLLLLALSAPQPTDHMTFRDLLSTLTDYAEGQEGYDAIEAWMVWWYERMGVQVAAREDVQPEPLDLGIFAWPKASHYNTGAIEAIDVIEDGGHGRGFAYGNAIKYLLRAAHKGCERDDLIKAGRYIGRLLTTLSADD